MTPRMGRRKKGRVEIIPMIDVMLFLLVFFIMITMQMISDRGLHLNLPASSQAHTLPHPHFVINVKSPGTVVVNDKRYDLAALVKMLHGDGDPAKTQVTIAADKKVPFQQFVHVMDACRKAGVSQIGIATEPKA
ncbi:biopolymer transporter ExbD [Acidiferrobacter sp.]|uniref:ExbD/TolR family protein n=1 Tax=Acidiferrobacter sp. TaxID=1872107 RepID=UPI00344EF581